MSIVLKIYSKKNINFTGNRCQYIKSRNLQVHQYCRYKMCHLQSGEFEREVEVREFGIQSAHFFYFFCIASEAASTESTENLKIVTEVLVLLLAF